MNYPKIKIILFVFLAAGTVLCHAFLERYEKSGPEMLTGTWQFTAPRSCKVQIKKTKLSLFSPALDKSVNIHQDIHFFRRGATLKLSADMKYENIRPGQKPWNRARLLLVQYDGHKDRWDLSHLVASFTGTRGWESFHKFFTIGPETRKIKVTAQLSQCSGSFQLKNIRLYPVAQTQIFTWVKKIILSLWGFFAIFLLGSCFYCGRKTMGLQAMLVIAFIAIIIGTTIPGDLRAQVLNEVKTQIHILPWDLSKVGHFCFFTVFGLILCLLLNLEPAIVVMINILLLAGGTEIAQLYIDGRTPLFWDFVIDAAGGFSGIIIIKLFGMKRHETKLEI